MLTPKSIKNTEELPVGLASGKANDHNIYVATINSVSNSISLFLIENNFNDTADTQKASNLLLFDNSHTHSLKPLGSFQLGTIGVYEELRSPTSISSCSSNDGTLYFCVAAVGLSLIDYDVTNYYIATYRLEIADETYSLTRCDIQPSGELVTCFDFNDKNYVAVSNLQVGVELWEITSTGKLKFINNLPYNNFFPRYMNCACEVNGEVYILTANTGYNNIIVTRFDKRLILERYGEVSTGKLPQDISITSTAKGETFVIVSNSGDGTINLFEFNSSNEQILTLCDSYFIGNIPQGVSFITINQENFIVVLLTKEKSVKFLKMNNKQLLTTTESFNFLEAIPTSVININNEAIFLVTTFGELKDKILTTKTKNNSVINMPKISDWLVTNSEHSLKIEL